MERSGGVLPRAAWAGQAGLLGEQSGWGTERERGRGSRRLVDAKRSRTVTMAPGP